MNNRNTNTIKLCEDALSYFPSGRANFSHLLIGKFSLGTNAANVDLHSFGDVFRRLLFPAIGTSGSLYKMNWCNSLSYLRHVGFVFRAFGAARQSSPAFRDTLSSSFQSLVALRHFPPRLLVWIASRCAVAAFRHVSKFITKFLKMGDPFAFRLGPISCIRFDYFHNGRNTLVEQSSHPVSAITSLVSAISDVLLQSCFWIKAPTDIFDGLRAGIRKGVDMPSSLCFHERIIPQEKLLGYEDEHAAHMPRTWRMVAWKANGGMSNNGDGSNLNRHKERLWLSPHCLRPMPSLFEFGD